LDCFPRQLGFELPDGGSRPTIQGIDVDAERQRIRRERAKSEEDYKRALKACYQTFAVNRCKQQALDVKIKSDNALRQQDIVLNDAVRKQRSDQALQRIEEKNSAEQQFKEQEERDQRRKAYLDKLQENLEKNEKQLQKQDEVEANRERYQQRLDDIQERRRVMAEKAAQAAKKREENDRKQQEAQKHRQSVQRDAAERKPDVPGLPLPSTSDKP
jgi:hypothetical protein